MRKFFLFSIFCLWLSGHTLAQQLPISRVLLYKNGMAYIVRTGAIQEPLSLSFHPQDMKDILKTFTAWNPASGNLYSVGYTTGVPLTEVLGRFPFRVSNANGGLAGFLAQVQGAQLQLSVGSKRLSGQLMSLSREQHAVHPQTLIQDHVLSIRQDSGAIETAWLSEVNSLQLADSELNGQLETYLKILAEGNQDVSREITVYPVPEGGRIQVAYIQQFPVWKTSYRVDLTEPEGSIQGWAQVDNPTGEAWNNVDLTLISGMPVSFIMDLYEPLYTTRTTVPVPGARVAAPRRYESAVRTREQEGVAPQEKAAVDEVRDAARALRAAPQMARGEGGGTTLTLSPEAPGFKEAEAAQVQDYFEYRFPFPIRLANQQSALLPFVRKKISLETVSIFNSSSDQSHPQSGAWLENSTGIPLEAGPVTFFAEGRYAGEALLGYLSPGERRLVSYGVDYDVEIATERKSEPETTIRLTINRGTILFQREQIHATLYQLRNKANRAKTVLIEHPRQPGRELKDVKPAEVTQNFFRFRAELAAGQEMELPVTEILSRQTALSIRELDRRQLEVHFAGVKIPSDLKQKLEEIVAVRERVASLQGQVQVLQTEMDSIFRDQARLRENLGALGHSEEERQLRQRYLNQLNQQEDRLAQLNQRIQALSQQISDQENALSRLIANLSVSVDLRG